MLRFVAPTVVLTVASFAVTTASAQVADMQQRIEVAAPLVPGSFKAFAVPSSGAIADETFIATSKLRGPSAIAKQLARVLEAADSSQLIIVVTGPSDAKTAQVIRDALAATGKTSLPLLTLVFVGGERASSEVQDSVSSYGATYKFAKYPPGL